MRRSHKLAEHMPPDVWLVCDNRERTRTHAHTHTGFESSPPEIKYTCSVRTHLPRNTHHNTTHCYSITRHLFPLDMAASPDRRRCSSPAHCSVCGRPVIIVCVCVRVRVRLPCPLATSVRVCLFVCGLLASDSVWHNQERERELFPHLCVRKRHNSLTR